MYLWHASAFKGSMCMQNWSLTAYMAQYAHVTVSYLSTHKYIIQQTMTMT